MELMKQWESNRGTFKCQDSVTEANLCQYSDQVTAEGIPVLTAVQSRDFCAEHTS